MHAATLAARRVAAYAGLFAAVLGLAALVTALVVGIPRQLELASLTSTRETLASAKPMDAALRVQIRLADDPIAQSAAVEDAVRRLVGDTPIVIHRSVLAPVSIATGAVTDSAIPLEPAVLVLADEGAASRATLVEGDWGAALQADAAAILGVGVHDVVLLDPEIGDDGAVTGGHSVTVTGLWGADDASDPAWFGDAAVASGESAEGVGPLLVDETVLASLDANPFTRWTVVPDVDRMRTADLAGLTALTAGIDAALREVPGLTASGLIVEGALGETAGTLQRSADAVRGVSPMPLVLAAVIGFIALWQLARLLAEVRGRETVLLSARGRSAVQATLSAAVEGVVVVVPGVALGAGIAIAVVPSPAVPITGSLVAAALVALVGIVTLAVVGLLAARAPSSRLEPSRAPAGVTAGGVALAVIAAGVSVWQFRLYGSPLVTAANGDRVVDPVAVLAPPLAILACGAIAVGAFGPLANLWSRLVVRRPGITAVLPARQVARRAMAFVVPLVLTSLAVSGTTLAAGYDATWSTLTERAGQLRNGAPVRVQLPGAATVGRTPVTAVALGDVTDAATPVLLADTVAGDSDVTLVSIAATEIPAVMGTLGGTLDTTALAQSVGSPTHGIELPTAARELSITIDASTELLHDAQRTPGQGDVALTVWIMDAQGALARLPLDPDGHGVIPSGATPWSVLALDASVTTGANPAVHSVEVREITADGVMVPLPTGAWQLAPDAMDVSGTVDAMLTGVGFRAELEFTPRPAVVRLMPPDPQPAVPAEITQAFADRLGLTVGDVVQLRVAGSGLTATVGVAGILPLLPGSLDPFVALVDLRALDDHLLRQFSSIPAPEQLWAVGDEVAVAAAVPEGSRVTTPQTGSGSGLLRPVVVALWIGAAGSLALALAALAAVSGALTRSRNPEVVVLRSLGLSDAQQARARGLELAAVTGFGVVFGLLGGVLVSHLTVVGLARSAVLDAPASLPADVAFAVPPGLSVLGAFLLGAAAIITVQARRVRRQAATSTGREVSA